MPFRTSRPLEAELDTGSHRITFEQTELFTTDPVSLSELMQHQNIGQPQGLESLVDPEWEEGVASDLFLAAMLDDAE